VTTKRFFDPGATTSADNAALLTADTVSFSQNSTATGQAQYNACISCALMYLIWPVIYVALMITRPGIAQISNVWHILFFAIITVGALMILSMGAPWIIKLHFDSRTYDLTTGYRPFRRHQDGKFDDIVGLGVEYYKRTKSAPAYLVRLHVGSRATPKSIWINQFAELYDAVGFAHNFAERFGKSLVDSDGFAIQQQTLIGEQITFTSEDNSFQRRKARSAHRSSVIFGVSLLLVPAGFWWVYPLLVDYYGGPVWLPLTCVAVPFLVLWLYELNHISSSSAFAIQFDRLARTYTVKINAGPLRVKSGGSYDQINSLALTSMKGYKFAEPFLIALELKRPALGRKTFMVGCGYYSEEEGKQALAELSSFLGIESEPEVVRKIR
jgi:hypothetical protein